MALVSSFPLAEGDLGSGIDQGDGIRMHIQIYSYIPFGSKYVSTHTDNLVTALSLSSSAPWSSLALPETLMCTRKQTPGLHRHSLM